MPAAVAALLGSLAASAVAAAVTCVITVVMVFVLGTMATMLVAPTINAFGDWASNWMTIPVVNNVILWGQVISVTIAAAVRVWVGIRTVMMADGGPNPPSLGEYVFKSIGAIALVGLMPILCSLVISFGQMMMRDVLGLAGPGTLTLQAHPEHLFALADDPENGMALIANSLVCCLMVLIAGVMCVKVLYELLKRQAQMLIISAVAPWVGITAAVDGDATYWEYLRSLFGMCVVQWCQYLFMVISLQMLEQFIGGDVELYELVLINPLDPGDLDGFAMALVCLAMFGATLSVPGLLDRWTFGSSSTNAGNMVVGLLARKGGAAAGGVGRSVEKAAGRGSAAESVMAAQK